MSRKLEITYTNEFDEKLHLVCSNDSIKFHHSDIHQVGEYVDIQKISEYSFGSTEITVIEEFQKICKIIN